jgi:hypothetical protein
MSISGIQADGLAAFLDAPVFVCLLVERHAEPALSNWILWVEAQRLAAFFNPLIITFPAFVYPKLPAEVLMRAFVVWVQPHHLSVLCDRFFPIVLLVKRRSE